MSQWSSYIGPAVNDEGIVLPTGIKTKMEYTHFGKELVSFL